MPKPRSRLIACAILGALFLSPLLPQAAAAGPLTVTVSRPPVLTVAFNGARGEPLFALIPGTTLLRAVNASVPLVLDPEAGSYYLFASDACMAAPALSGPWRETMALPASFYGLPQTDAARALREFVDARLLASRNRREPVPSVVLDDSGVTMAANEIEDSWDSMVHPEAEPLNEDAHYYHDGLYAYGGVGYVPWFGACGLPKPVVCHGKHSGFSGASCSRTGFAHCGSFRGSRLGFGHASLAGTGLGVGSGPGFGFGLGVGCGPGFGNGLGVGSGRGFGNGLGVGSSFGLALGGGLGGGFGACAR